MNYNQVLEKVTEIIVGKTGYSDPIYSFTSLDSLEMESLDEFEIVSLLEDEYGIEFSATLWNSFNTVGDIVTFISGQSDEPRENDLTFSGEVPVVVNFNGDTTDIYNPLRTSSCDINIVSNKILDDLYTAKKDEVCVKVEKTGYEIVETKVLGTSPRREVRTISPVKVYYEGALRDCVIVPNNPYPLEMSVYHYESNDYSYFLNARLKCYLPGGETRIIGPWFKYSDTRRGWELMGSEFDMQSGESLVELGYTLTKVKYYNGNYEYRYWSESSQSWGTAFPAQYVDKSGVVHTFNYAMNVENVFHYLDETYFFGSYGYANTCMLFKWNKTMRQWKELDMPVFDDGSSYFSIDGSNKFFRNIGRGEIYYPCNALHKGDEPDANWIVELVYDGGESFYLHRHARIPDNVDIDNVFPGNRCILAKDNDGNILFLTLEREWVGTGMSVPKNAAIFLKSKDQEGYYIMTENAFFDQSNPDSQYYVWVLMNYYDGYNVITTEERREKDPVTVWEGYMTPNVYSQELTQNLDQISFTCIDPISIMKYVKINKIMTRPNVVSYAELIGKALAFVKLDNDILEIEDNMRYDDEHSTFTHLLSMRCQVSNFWDEAGEPSTIYDMISELLRPFCLTMTYDGKKFIIYDSNKVNKGEKRNYDVYRITDEGTLVYLYDYDENISDDIWEFSSGEWKSNNTSPASLEISQTYDKVTGVASTSIPSYSMMAFDLVDYNERDKYDYFFLNVQKNKSKGYNKDQYGNYSNNVDEKDYWFYLWNGVYVNEDYNLKSYTGLVNGYLNMIGAYNYLHNDRVTWLDDSGNILNFYGGANNPTGTGKEQRDEKGVDVRKCITAYAPDNGIAPEFLEHSDLEWDYDSNYDYASEGFISNPKLLKTDVSDIKWGEGKTMGNINRVVYHQEYPNMTLLSGHDQIFDLSLSQAYSRTGINTEIDVMDNNTCYDKLFCLHDWDTYYFWILDTAKVNYFPDMWNSKNIYVRAPYFDRYSAGFRGTSEIWDKRRINLYVALSDGTIYQFNGKDWIEDTQVREANSFSLVKLVNGEKLFHNDMKYNLIEVAGSEDVRNRTFSLDDEEFEYRTDSNGAVVEKGGTNHSYDIYKKEGEDRVKWINGCSDGSLSILLPPVNAVNATVVCDVYNSSMLGMTGTDNTNRSMRNDVLSFRYTLEGTGRIRGDQTEEPERRFPLTPDMFEPGFYGRIFGQPLEEFNCMPVNLTYVKAEHLDLSMEVSVPQSNLGQMFSESDIKYTIDKSQNYLEEFNGPSFRVNTYHPLVSASYSYLIHQNDVAEADKFIFRERISARPEAFTVQAYINWLCRIRKIYGKTLVPVEKDKDFNNVSTYIVSPEIGRHKLMVVSDSWDLKTNRHSIKAIEDHDMQVESMDQLNVVEIPRRARNERYNLPTAVRK